MPITQEQLAARRAGIGSSDAACIFGLGYHTARSLWYDKTGRVPLEDEPPSEQARIGNMTEAVVLDMMAEDLDVSIKTGITFEHPDGINRSNPDAVVLNGDSGTITKPTTLAEAKSTGLPGWGDPEIANDVPERVLIQTHHQMYCTGAQLVYVPVLFGKFGLSFKVYRVERDDSLCALIAERCLEWWQRHVVADTEPEGDIDLEVVKRVVRKPEKSIIIDDDVVDTWRQLRDQRLDVAKREKAALANLVAMLGDAEVGLCNFGKFTYRTQHRKGYTVKPTSFPVASFKEKEGDDGA